MKKSLLELKEIIKNAVYQYIPDDDVRVHNKDQHQFNCGLGGLCQQANWRNQREV